MSSSKHTDVVQAQVKAPSLDALNPLNSNEPLIQTLAQGQVPSNAVINDALDRAKGSIEVSRQDTNLTERGDILAKDAEAILESAQRFVNEKNKGDKIQDLIKHTQDVSNATASEVSRTSHSLTTLVSNSLGLNRFLPHKDIREAQSDAQKAYGYVQELALFAVQSKEFRSLLLDIINFLQSSLDSANEKVQQIGDSLKTDVNRQDTNLSATKGTAEKVKDDTKEAVDEKQVQWSEETKREYYRRFQALLDRISKRPEYKRLLDLYWKWMDDLQVRANEISTQLAETAKETANQASTKVTASAQRIASNAAWDRLWNDIRGIFDSFAGKGMFDNFYNGAWDLYMTLASDPSAKAYLQNVKSFINNAVADPASLNADLVIKQGEDLLARGNYILKNPKFSRRFNGLLNDGSFILDKVANDAVSNELASNIRKFAEDFALDGQGRPDLNVMQESMVQIKNLMFPFLTKQLSSLNVAKVAGTNENYDWSVEHLLISVPDLIPEFFELRTKNMLSINVKKMETEVNNTKVTLELKNLRPCFKDLKFWYQRKVFPKMEDYGNLDVDLSKGNGMRLKVIWKIKSKQNRPFAFSLMEVRCVIDNLEVTVKDAKHEYLDKFAVNMFSSHFKQQIAASVVNNLVDTLQPFNDQMNAWFASRPTNTIAERANETLHYYYDQTNSAIKDRPVDRLMEKAKEAVEYVKENVDTAKSTLSEKAADLRGYVSEKSTEASQKIQETFPTLTEDIKEGVAKVQESISSAKSTVQDKVEEVKKEVNEKGVVEAVKEEATDLKEEAQTNWDHAWQKKPMSRSQKRHLKKLREKEATAFPPTEYPPLSSN